MYIYTCLDVYLSISLYIYIYVFLSIHFCRSMALRKQVIELYSIHKQETDERPDRPLQTRTSLADNEVP